GLAGRRRQAGGTLSGAEQQMLAIGRAMMNFPKLLMLDEPSLGLSPVLAELVFERLAEIRRQGTTILLVEQNATCLDMATGGVILANGCVALAGDRPSLADSDVVRRAYRGAWRGQGAAPGPAPRLRRQIARCLAHAATPSQAAPAPRGHDARNRASGGFRACVRVRLCPPYRSSTGRKQMTITRR